MRVLCFFCGFVTVILRPAAAPPAGASASTAWAALPSGGGAAVPPAGAASSAWAGLPRRWYDVTWRLLVDARTVLC